MQKKIIALAIAGLSTAAFAQSNVTVYGNLDASIVKYSGTSAGVPGTAVATTTAGTGSITKLDGNLIKQSRLGFKGEEGLGGGSKALFTAEMGLASDGGAGAQYAGASGLGGAARQMFVGLESPYGTTTLGRQYTPFFSTVAAVDNFNTTGVANAGNIHALAGQTVRFSSSVKYVTPSFSGLTASAMIGMAETPSDATTSAKGTSLNLVYANGPIVAAAATLTVKDADLGNGATVTSATGGAVTGAVAAGSNAIPVAGNKVKASVFGGVYNMGVARLGGAYVITKADTAAATIIDTKGWHLNGTVPMGAHSFKAQFNKVTDKLTANGAQDATHWGLGYQYDLSKRTQMAVQYGKVNNKNGAAYGVDPRTTLAATGAALSATAAAAAGASREKAIVFGMNHDF